MKISDLFADEELRLREFPVARDKIFLAHGGVSPLPRRVADAIHDYTRRATADDQETVLPMPLLAETRELAAQFLGGLPEEIALVGPTSLALSFVAAGLPLRKGDNILIYFDDYPSNVYPWMALAEKGVEVRLMNVRELGRIRPIDVEGQVDEDTRLVALASCHFVSGWRIDIQAIGKLLHARGIAFCVDGIQTVGAFPTSIEHVDFLAADAHKWMLGPCAAGILYVAKAWHEKLKPTVHGWHNIRCPNYVAQSELVFRRDARRYEAGTANLLGLAGLHAALQLLLDVGVENIANELLRKRRWVVQALREKGYTVLHADAPDANIGSMITFFRPQADLTTLQQKLADNRIVASLRSDRSGQKYIRLSPHFYNTDAELQQVLSLL